MDWKKVFEKGLKGVIPALLALGASQLPALTNWLVGLIPENVAQLTVAGVVAFVVNSVANWFKHRNK